MSEQEDPLAAVFKEFCSFGMGSRNVGPPLMDSRQCQKLARDCRILDKRLTKVDIDLVFTAVKGRGEHRIDYLDFLECVRQWAERKGVSYEDLCEMIAHSQGPTLNHVTTPDAQKFSSPLYEAAPRTAPASGISPPSGASVTPPPGRNTSGKRDSKAPPPPPANTQLHPDWYEVQNPDPQGPDELVYYVNRKTNETSWNRPVLVSPPHTGRSFDDSSVEDKDGSNSFRSRASNSPYKSVFDKLTDHTLYTGTHKHRFDPETGQGRGSRGRESIGKGHGTALDSSTTFQGNTNTGTDEVIHDISQIVIRK